MQLDASITAVVTGGGPASGPRPRGGSLRTGSRSRCSISMPSLASGSPVTSAASSARSM